MSDVLQPVQPQPGSPLYVAVKQAVLEAIREGKFKPGQRIPSTKELSKQLSVSLVTTHRALQELEQSGFLERTQGRGTFVADYKNTPPPKMRVGLVLQPQASMADFYHSQLLEGMSNAAREHGADLWLMHTAEKLDSGCDAFLLINPLMDTVDIIVKSIGHKAQVLVVGAAGTSDSASVDVDNVDLANQAVEHLHKLGHRRIAYIGGAEELSNSLDRHRGFLEACARLGLAGDDAPVIEAESWKLSSHEVMQMHRLLNGPDRPTAVFAGGYYFALDVYNTATTLGLSIPDDLSVVGVDDPPSAAYLHPALTTIRQPLAEFGHSAVTEIVACIQSARPPKGHRKLRAELVIRESSGSVGG